MIDLHCHLLPGVDDGAGDLAEAVAMARLAAADGIGDVVVTPHRRHYRWPNDEGDVLEERFDRLRREVGPRPRLAMGAEVRVDSELVDDVLRGRRGAELTLAGSRYLLLEFDSLPVGPDAEDVVRELVVAGYVPVVAHPERLPWLADEPARLAGLVELGAWMQITAMSVTGDFGRRAERCCRFLIDEDLAHVLASDGHSVDRRPPVLSAARELIAREWGESVAERLTVTNPAAVLADRPATRAALPREAAQ